MEEFDALMTLIQASEWAMGIFQIPRLRTKLPVDDVKRGRLIHLSLLMNNYKVRCGIPNQVTTTFINNNIQRYDTLVYINMSIYYI